jgi:2Fe-2S ferredoxin
LRGGRQHRKLRAFERFPARFACVYWQHFGLFAARQQGKMMAGIVVIDRDGVEHEVEAKEGVSLMETLRDLDYGSPAICGGMCSCATCHVYVDEASLGRLAPMQGDEKELLVELGGYKPTSRLSCQVQFDASLAGIRVTIAPDE